MNREIVKYKGITMLAQPLLAPATGQVVGHLLSYALDELFLELTGAEVGKRKRIAIINTLVFDNNWDAWQWTGDPQVALVQAELEVITPADVIIFVMEQDYSANEHRTQQDVTPRQLRKLNTLMNWYNQTPLDVAVKEDKLIVIWPSGEAGTMVMGILQDGSSHT